MTKTIFAIFNKDVFIATISYHLRKLIDVNTAVGCPPVVCIRAFASLDGNGIVVDTHVAIFDQYVFHHIKVYGIGAGRFYWLCRRIDV